LYYSISGTDESAVSWPKDLCSMYPQKNLIPLGKFLAEDAQVFQNIYIMNFIQGVNTKKGLPF